MSSFVSTDLVWVRTMEQVKRWMAKCWAKKLDGENTKNWGLKQARKKWENDKTEEGW